MKPPRFEYFAARSEAEAVALLTEHGEGAKVLAGGQSLIPLLNFRLAQPDALVDVNPVGELAYVREDGGLAIGALTRLHAAESSPVVRTRVPVLAEACHLVGHLPIRHRGTIGGNLAHADPASELPAVMLALDAELTIASARGRRRVRAREFFTGALTTALCPGELLVEVRVPASAPRTGGAFVEVSRRAGDYALAGVAALVTLDRAGGCAEARIAMCGVGATPLRAPEAEAALAGGPIDDARLAEAAERAAAGAAPPSDVHASAGYRRKLVRHLVPRAVLAAAERARGA
ncbi:MAG: xanthine dehydrogenase family protein subunit M [Candidatus Rokubacteria bacterium]|nr:xanthine dehydrogenase family protein subunit M [Candidatus Rokubacteria bacterium]